MRRTLRAFLLCVPLSGCCTTFGLGDPPPPPPVPDGGVATTTALGALPPGQVSVTVAASSTPPGAVVTGGGAQLGTTPFVVQVPVPAPSAGQVQSFEFTFQLPGFQPTTLTATPVNNTVTIQATLTPLAPATGAALPVAAAGTRITARGGADSIPDLGTARSAVQIAEQCVVGALTVDLEGTHTFFSDLSVSLQAPDGTSFPLQRRARRDPFRTHTVRRAAGHMSQGTWTLIIADQVRADVGALRGWSMRLDCR